MNNDINDTSESSHQKPAEQINNEAESNDSIAILNDIESRVLGALMEKQLATPDAYPLTVNSLIAACNQKSNREPVSNYQQGEIANTLRKLESRSLIRYEMGARSERYEQRLTNYYSLSKKQQALLTVMMLRGSQTARELSTRTQRLYEYSDHEDMMVSLERLTQGDKPFVVLIPKSAGQREDRYGHLLCDSPNISATSKPNSNINQTDGNQTAGVSDRSSESELVAEVALLRKQLDELYELTGHSKNE